MKIPHRAGGSANGARKTPKSRDLRAREDRVHEKLYEARAKHTSRQFAANNPKQYAAHQTRKRQLGKAAEKMSLRVARRDKA